MRGTASRQRWGPECGPRTFTPDGQERSGLEALEEDMPQGPLVLTEA